MYVSITSFRTIRVYSIGYAISAACKLLAIAQCGDELAFRLYDVVSRHDMDYSVAVLLFENHSCKTNRWCCVAAHWFDDDGFSAKIMGSNRTQLFGNYDDTLRFWKGVLYSLDCLCNEWCFLEYCEKLFGHIWLAHRPESFAPSACQNYSKASNN